MKKGGMKAKSSRLPPALARAMAAPPMAGDGAAMPGMPGMKRGGSVKKFAGGGVTRGDGIAQRGHTRGKNR